MKTNLIFMLWYFQAFAQSIITGTVSDINGNLPMVNIKTQILSTISNDDGSFTLNLPPGKHILQFSSIGYRNVQREVDVKSNSIITLNIYMLVDDQFLDEVVVSGTLRPIKRSETAVPVEIYTAAFFKKNPTSNIFEGLQNVNGVRPQLNCNICNTGDIHINGLEGPYTLVLIDGMPIVSGLSTVYGLSGIPNSLLERVEIIKGPASSLYGSEAVGGLINIITKSAETAPKFSADIFSTNWGEVNTDISFKSKIGKANMLTGVNYFFYGNKIDNNKDNFTDIALQHRVSLFNKWSFERENRKRTSIAARLYYEDRWGGEMQWNSDFRGGNEVYGESIYTKRAELFGLYDFQNVNDLTMTYSFTAHDQNSAYGDVLFLAKQNIGFGQITWSNTYNKYDILVGSALRYQYYEDNTPATNTSNKSFIPGIFVQDEMKFDNKNTLLLGARLDYNNNHGFIPTPRVAYRYQVNDRNIFRVNAGTGFRVVNLFTEEHAAISGARNVIIKGDLDPEQTYNVNLNWLSKFNQPSGNFYSFEASAWYTHFTNAIIPNYDQNPNQIIYDNLDGYSLSKGISINSDFVFNNGLKALLGITVMDVSKVENGFKTRQVLTERFSVTWVLSYTIPKWSLELDYTGNLYGPMRLPLLGEFDPRPEYSPTWSVQNIQGTFKKWKNTELYLGIKNLLNWTPNKNIPFLIARSNDPFDKEVTYNANGSVQTTANNPHGLTFDPSYMYAPNQGIRLFMGFRVTIQ